MERLNISATDATFIDALRTLIRTGAIAAPGLETSPLINLPVVVRYSGPDASAAKRAYVFIQVLQHVIRHRLDGKEAETANILFGFEGYAGVPIQDRYRAVAKLYKPYWTWENYRKEPLSRHLLAIYLTLKREVDLDFNSSIQSAYSRSEHSGLVGQDWVLEEFDGLFIFPSKNSQPIESIQKRRLRAMCDHIDVYRHPAYVRERGISSVPQLSLLDPGTVKVLDTHADTLSNLRTYITEVTFPKPIRYGESVEFTMLKRVDVRLERVLQKQGWDWYGLVSLASPAQSARISLRFPAERRPRAVWYYKDIISGLVRPGHPTPKTRLAVDSSGLTSYTWKDLSAGYSYGISLEW